MNLQLKTSALFLAAAIALPLPLFAATSTAPAADFFRTAPMLDQPEKASIFAVAKAGQRSVAVGDYGIVIYSDDGQTFHQAKVPTRAPLTSVFFIDGRRGWAAGHDGTVLTTSDGGENWQMLRETRGKDQVLMSIWFENAEHGLVVGQFGLAMETRDGGKSWQQRVLVEGEAGERHFQQIFSGGSGLLLVSAEAGTILRSADNGASWQAIQTDNKGSFWTGTALADGSLLMAGMRGHLYRSHDRGLSWQEMPTGTQQSLTAITQRPDGTVRVVGLGGVSLLSKDGGQHFTISTRPDRIGLTAIASGSKGELLFTSVGQVIHE